MATDLPDWQPFFAALLAAGSTLLGLIFVGLSLNLARILASPSLPRRAEIALLLIVLQIVIAALALMPETSLTAFALATLIAAVTGWLVSAWLTWAIFLDTPPAGRGLFVRNLCMLQAATLPFVAGPMLILARQPGGLHFVAAGMLLCIIKATVDAWVLLVEINR